MHLINAQQLKEWTGFDQEKRIIAWLNEHHIAWWAGKGGQPCTTEAQINASLGGEPKAVEFD